MVSHCHLCCILNLSSRSKPSFQDPKTQTLCSGGEQVSCLWQRGERSVSKADWEERLSARRKLQLGLEVYSKETVRDHKRL